MTGQAIPNPRAVIIMHSFMRIGLPILVILTILEVISSSTKQLMNLIMFLIIPQILFTIFLFVIADTSVIPKVLVFREDGVLITTRKRGFPFFTPPRKLLIKYDRISRIYEGSLTTRPAFVLVGARVLPGSWEERYFVTGRVAHLLRKNWEAHKLGHAMQYEM